MYGIIALFSAFLAHWPATSAAADAGTPGAYLRHEVGGRAAGLSGAYGALTDDASALLWNPAGLGRVAKPEVSLTHVVLYEDTSMDLGVGAMPIRGWGSFALGYLRQSTGGFERRASPLDPPIGFSITQTALLAGWGRAVAGLPFPVRVGSAVKSVRESIDTAGASGWGADLGLAFDPLPRLTFGLLVQNIVAPKLTFKTVPQEYPRMVDASAAYTWGSPRGLNAVSALRLANVDGEGTRVAGGVELWADRSLAVRFGSNGDGWSTGFGVRLGNLHIDYAALLADLGTSHQVTLRLQFGQTREELEELIQRGIQKVTKEEARRLARAYVRSAEQDMAENNYPKAISDLEAAALWDPEDPAIALRFQEVLAQVEQTVQRQIVERTTLLAEQQFKRGNWVASQTQWKSVLDVDANNPRAREALARIEQLLAERAQREEAQAAERDSQRLRVETARKDALDFVRRGEKALAQGRARDAAELALAAFKALPGLAEAEDLRTRAEAERVRSVQRGINEGERLAQDKHFDKALAAFEAVLIDDPHNARAREGIEKLRESMRARPPLSAESRKVIEKTYYLAVDAYLKGRTGDVQRHLDEIFKLDPDDENARKLKDKMDATLKLENK